jgi:hypothetical protein
LGLKDSKKPLTTSTIPLGLLDAVERRFCGSEVHVDHVAKDSTIC